MIEEVAKLIKESSKVVVICGKEVSDISGFPNIRSSTELFNGYAYSKIMGHDFLINEPEKFYDFFRKEILDKEYYPNRIHIFFAEMQKKKDITVITENIDGLQKESGIIKLIELHGNVKKYYCINCFEEYSSKSIQYSNGVPKCMCGGIIRPSIILNGESINGNELMKAAIAIQNADLVIICGNDLKIRSTAYLLNFYYGEKIVQINKEEIEIKEFDNVSLIGNLEDSIGKLEEIIK